MRYRGALHLHQPFPAGNSRVWAGLHGEVAWVLSSRLLTVASYVRGMEFLAATTSDAAGFAKDGLDVQLPTGTPTLAPLIHSGGKREHRSSRFTLLSQPGGIRRHHGIADHHHLTCCVSFAKDTLADPSARHVIRLRTCSVGSAVLSIRFVISWKWADRGMEKMVHLRVRVLMQTHTHTHTRTHIC